MKKSSLGSWECTSNSGTQKLVKKLLKGVKKFYSEKNKYKEIIFWKILKRHIFVLPLDCVLLLVICLQAEPWIQKLQRREGQFPSAKRSFVPYQTRYITNILPGTCWLNRKIKGEAILVGEEATEAEDQIARTTCPHGHLWAKLLSMETF
jgi:hypothetical protein